MNVIKGSLLAWFSLLIGTSGGNVMSINSLLTRFEAGTVVICFVSRLYGGLVSIAFAAVGLSLLAVVTVVVDVPLLRLDDATAANG